MQWNGIFKDFTNLFYPALCAACGNALKKKEKSICLNCKYTLPFTNFHLQPGNPLEKVFWGRFDFIRAASYLYFKKESRVQQLLHNIKYKGVKEAASLAGNWYGTQLIQEKAFADSDFIIPVPLFNEKQKARGFNQSEYFGKGLSSSLGCILDAGNLVRTRATETQTKKSRFMRWKNVEGTFFVKHPERLENKTIILVDDVITTGATLEACAQTLLSLNCGIKINIVTLAFAS